jgi:hypothetical protein
MPLATKILPPLTFLLRRHLGRYRVLIRQHPPLPCMRHPVPLTLRSHLIHTLLYPLMVQYHLHQVDRQVTYLRLMRRRRQLACLTATLHKTSLTQNLSPASPPFPYKRMRNFLVRTTVQSPRTIYQRTALVYPEGSGSYMIFYVPGTKQGFNRAIANTCPGLHWTIF